MVILSGEEAAQYHWARGYDKMKVQRHLAFINADLRGIRSTLLWQNQSLEGGSTYPVTKQIGL